MFNSTFLDSVAVLCEDLSTDVSRKVAELIRSDCHLSLLQLEIEFLKYDRNDVERFRNDYLSVEILSKYKGLTTNIDTKLVALDSFAAAERACFETNGRLTDFSSPEWARWSRVISLAQRNIENCIGSHPKFSKLLDRFKWGKGATFSLKGSNVRADYKLREKRISVTPQALPYLRAAMATDYAWLRSRGLVASGPCSLLSKDFDLVRGSRGITVPKNAKTDRFIAAEPSGNVFLQLGVGDLLRQCLLRVGVNLDDQRENQDLARVALDHSLATVDLKAASDTISWELVWLLLPLRWAELLSDLRSPEMLIDNSWLSLQKFSSMGNGFTFELESLIFWALTSALCQESGNVGIVSVYGDDIICPVGAVPLLIELFQYVGFTTNSKKTHFEGFFRESCGKHYFGGKDVTPIYQKEIPESDDIGTLYRCRNRLFYHALDRGALVQGGTALADRVLRRCVKRIDRAIGKLDLKLDYVPFVPSFSRKWFDTSNQLDSIKIWYDNTSDPVLDIGLAVDARELLQKSKGGYRGNVFRFQGWSDAWVYKGLRFKATEFMGLGDAILAMGLRSAGYAHRVEYYRIGEQMPRTDGSPASNGRITRRSVGRYTSARYNFPKPGELLWI